MSKLTRDAWRGLISLFAVLCAALFFPAWTWRYWQAWAFLAAFFGPVLFITVYLMKKNPELLERRVRSGPAAEGETVQKVIQAIAGVAFLALFIVSSLDRRFGWSWVPVPVEVGGAVLVVAGLLFVFWVFRANTFTSATIEIQKDQQVIFVGPYAWVRHPMYAGAFVMLLGVPLCLGSWWALAGLVPMVAAIVRRLLEEERFLAEKLAGYSDYSARVRYRLVPRLW